MLSYYLAMAMILLDSRVFAGTKICRRFGKCENQIIRSKHVTKQMDNEISKELVVTEKRPRNRCCPYDFDSSLCQIVDDRVLCGYNTNVGKPRGDSTPVELNGGCRLRGGRLECGYEEGPYTNIRRPPAWNEEHGDDNNDNLVEDPIGDDDENQTDIGDDSAKEKLQFTKSYPSTGGRRVTRCVEISDRIVCKKW